MSLAEALVIKGMCLRMKGAHADSKETLMKARSILLEHDGPTSLLTEARTELGGTFSLCGELDQAYRELKGVLDVYEAKGDMYNIAYVSDQVATVLALMGRTGDAAVHLERARRCWTKLGNDERLLQTMNNLGVLYYLQGDFEQAESVLSQGLQKATSVTNPRPEVYLLALRRRRQARQGRVRGRPWRCTIKRAGDGAA